MEATAHIAALVIQQMYCKLEGGKPCNSISKASEKLSSLKDWASKDEGWERVLSSLSLYELAKRFWQQEEYERALVAVEQSIALKLFPYAEPGLLERWQRSLVAQGQQFVRQKSELADALMLKADCLVELALMYGKVHLLHEAMDSLKLATSLLSGAAEQQGPTSETAANLKTVAAQVAVAGVELLPKLRISKIRELLDMYAIPCNACVEKQHLLSALLAGLQLPVVQEESTGRLEPLEDPLQLISRPGARTQQAMADLLDDLLELVPKRFLEDLKVACAQPHGSPPTCTSYLPPWANAARSGARQRQLRQQQLEDGAEEDDEEGEEGRGGEGGGGEPPDGACSEQRFKASACAGRQQEGRAADEGQGQAAAAADVLPSSNTGSECGAGVRVDDATLQAQRGSYLTGMGTLIESMLRADYGDVQGLVRKLDRIIRGQAEACSKGGPGHPSCTGLPHSCGSASSAGSAGNLHCNLRLAPGGPASVYLVDDLAPDALLDDHHLHHHRHHPGASKHRGAGAGGAAPRHAPGGGSAAGGGGLEEEACVGGPGGLCGAGEAAGMLARDMSDRQLREHLAKVAAASPVKLSDRDSPLIPVVLCVCILGGLGLCISVKHKRRIQRFLSHGVRAGRDTRAAATRDAPAAAVPTAKQIAASLRDALASGDAAKLEAAVRQAEELEFDQPILGKARVALQQRRRKERERAAAERAARREAERRLKAKSRRRTSGSGTDGGCGDGEGPEGDGGESRDGGVGGGGAPGAGGKRTGWLAGILQIARACMRPRAESPVGGLAAGGGKGGEGSGGGGARGSGGGSCWSGSGVDGGSPGKASDVSPYDDTDHSKAAASRAGSDATGGLTLSRANSSSTAGDLQLAAMEDSAFLMMYAASSSAPRSETGSDSDGWQEQTHSRRRSHAPKPPSSSSSSAALPPLPPPPAPAPAPLVLEVVRTRAAATGRPILTALAPAAPASAPSKKLSGKAAKPPRTAAAALAPKHRRGDAPATAAAAAAPKPTSSWLGWLGAAQQHKPPTAAAAAAGPSTSATPAASQPSTPVNRWSQRTPATPQAPPKPPTPTGTPARPDPRAPPPLSRTKLDPNAPPYQPTSLHTPPRAPSTPPPAASPSLARPSTSPRTSSSKAPPAASKLTPLHVSRAPYTPAPYPQCPSPNSLQQFGIIASPDPLHSYMPHPALPASPWDPVQDTSPHASSTYFSPTPTHAATASASTSAPHPSPPFTTSPANLDSLSLFTTTSASPLLPPADTPPTRATPPNPFLSSTASYSYFTNPPAAPAPAPPAFLATPSFLPPAPAPAPPAAPPTSFYNMFGGTSLWNPDLPPSAAPDDTSAWQAAQKHLSGGWTAAAYDPQVDPIAPAAPHPLGSEVLGSSVGADLPDPNEWVRDMLKGVVD